MISDISRPSTPEEIVARCLLYRVKALNGLDGNGRKGYGKI